MATTRNSAGKATSAWKRPEGLVGRTSVKGLPSAREKICASAWSSAALSTSPNTVRLWGGAEGLRGPETSDELEPPEIS